jgi:hypothetical protein
MLLWDFIFFVPMQSGLEINKPQHHIEHCRTHLYNGPDALHFFLYLRSSIVQAFSILLLNVPNDKIPLLHASQAISCITKIE